MGDAWKLLDRLKHIADSDPAAPALSDGGERSLDFGDLGKCLEKSAVDLRAAGIGNQHRVASVIRDGLHGAFAYLAVSDSAVFMPLSPDYSKEQFLSYFDLLKPDCLLLEQDPTAGSDAAGSAALDCGIPVLRFEICFDKGSGKVERVGWNGAADGQIGRRTDSLPHGRIGDISLVVCTSGTTATPKVMALGRQQLIESAAERIDVFELERQDRCLVVTPFYKSVTISLLLSTLLAGGCAICVGRLVLSDFFTLLEKARPTWFTAPPALLRSVVDHAAGTGARLSGGSLRFIRSSGASLPEKLYESLRELFGVPVVVTYGTSETRMIATTYNAPKGHRPGSVGMPTGSGVMIVDGAGRALPAGKVGEVVVKGTSVISGYEDDRHNKDAFYGEWFRTGDLGCFDEDGYLFLTGRIKEIINRGGEKISPYEVEHAILMHPDVLDAAVFPIPARNGSEDPAAAVVLRPGSDLDLAELRRFLGNAVVPYKMPVALYLVPSIPVGSEGKVQRSALFGRLSASGDRMLKIGDRRGSKPAGGFIRPKDDFERVLLQIWKKALRLKQVAQDDRFQALGGDSLKAAFVFAEIEMRLEKRVPMDVLLRDCTFREMADALRGGEAASLLPFAVPFENSGEGAPLFIIHGALGEITNYPRIAALMKEKRPVYGLRFNKSGKKWRHPLTIGQIASAYLEDVLRECPDGCCHIAGYCLGGVIAFEMARQMEARGHRPPAVIMFDPTIRDPEDEQDPAQAEQKGGIRNTMLGRAFDEGRKLPRENRGDFLRWKVRRKLTHLRNRYIRMLYVKTAPLQTGLFFGMLPEEMILRSARKLYTLADYEKPVFFLAPEHDRGLTGQSVRAWREAAADVRVRRIGGSHPSLLAEEHIESLAATIESCIDEHLQALASGMPAGNGKDPG